MRIRFFLIIIVVFSGSLRPDESSVQAPARSQNVSEIVEAEALLGTARMSARKGDRKGVFEALNRLKKIKLGGEFTRRVRKRYAQGIKNSFADAYAESAPLRKGFVLAGSLNTGEQSSIGTGAGLIMAWHQLNPSQISWGLKISGWYCDVKESTGEKPLDKYAHWGNWYGMSTQIEWMPWHGRGRRNRYYLHLATGPGFYQLYRNLVWTDRSGSAPVEKLKTQVDYRIALISSVGIGFGSRFGYNFLIGVNSINAGSAIELGHIDGILSASQPYASLGYIF